MMTLEGRLATIVSLLPNAAKPDFAGPLKKGEGIEARLADAIRALAKTEGLICMTEQEFAQAVLKKAVERNISLLKPAADGPDGHGGLAARFAAIKDPRAQTAFWRSLTPPQRASLLLEK
jgi:hypothetical protein